MRSLNTLDGLPIHWRQWARRALTSARGTVLLVHGLGEHVGRYEALAELLNEWGWHVVGYDQRGHGASGGGRGDLSHADALLEDLALVVDSVRQDVHLGKGPLVLLGHSLGALVAARFVLGQLQRAPWARPVDALALSSPALQADLSVAQQAMLALGRRILPHLAVDNGLKPQWLSRRSEVVQAYEDDPLVHDRISGTLAAFITDSGPQLLQAAPHWTLPTLLLWGGADRCVNPAGSAAFAAAAPASLVQAHCLEAAFHEIFNDLDPEREQALQHLRHWLDERG
ncbi:alpha/beta fold hydrolase [Roseateles sp. BYS180W]|uniref:Alpha/beta fold hydrolase n=1 Tax=Roseateles rivi TaxID=3299028 RepID=A0ABW7FTD0_9BURK